MKSASLSCNQRPESDCCWIEITGVVDPLIDLIALDLLLFCTVFPTVGYFFIFVGLRPPSGLNGSRAPASQSAIDIVKQQLAGTCDYDYSNTK